jgi:hypothetical protein
MMSLEEEIKNQKELCRQVVYLPTDLSDLDAPLRIDHETMKKRNEKLSFLLEKEKEERKKKEEEEKRKKKEEERKKKEEEWYTEGDPLQGGFGPWRPR